MLKFNAQINKKAPIKQASQIEKAHSLSEKLF